VYGEELISEPSQFLNEMPLDLIEDLTRGKSWLAFARGSSAVEYEQGEYRKERNKYTGKTYDSVESIADFFNQRAQQFGRSGHAPARPANFRSATSRQKPSPAPNPTEVGDFVPGSYVKHAKYGRGLVLRREGAGESLKLTVSFPGYGQKKLVQKFANLEKG
jgi:DNA helicase-2/ATP-dependent DNA helicase PcrA